MLVRLNELVALLVRIFHKLGFVICQRPRRPHVADADREAPQRQCPGTELGQPVHGSCRIIRPKISEDHVKDGLLVAASDRRLVHPPAHDLGVANHKEGVVDVHVRNVAVVFLVEDLVFRVQVDKHGRFLVGAHEDVEDLLARPESLGLDDGGWGQLKVGVAQEHLSADVGKRRPIEEVVLATQQVGRRDEILGGGDDGLTVLGRDEVVFHAH